MGHQVVCRVHADEPAGTLQFTWSVGSSAFPPYALDGDLVAQFREHARQARDRLFDLVELYRPAAAARDDSAIRLASLELARVGHDLSNLLFAPEARPRGVTRTVRRWLREVTETDGVVSLEVVSDGQPWFAPWNLVYDADPDEALFLDADPKADGGHDIPAAAAGPFWGVRYNLCGGLQVEPLRRKRLPSRPDVLLVLDPVVGDGLDRHPDRDGQTLGDRLRAFVADQEAAGARVARSRDQLRRALKTRPHLIYWLGHADPSYLALGADRVTLEDLGKFLRDVDDEAASPGGLVFLNACRTAESPDRGLGSFLKAFHDADFSGLVATEERTLDNLASPFGLEALHAFLRGGEPIGAVLQRLRTRHAPLGLVYGTYCPPDLQVRPEAPAQGPSPVPHAGLPGHAAADILSAPAAASAPAAEPLLLPDEPYLPLAAYGPEHRALFTGREGDVERFTRLLGRPETRVLLLHGESGVGKTSFLNAGVVPYLDEVGVGFRHAGAGGGVISVRATDDPAGQLAGALVDFASRPYPFTTPAGEPEEVDLAGPLAAALGTPALPTPAEARAALLADPARLDAALGALAAVLPLTPVLIVDQAEEIFTLTEYGPDGPANRDAVLGMLTKMLARVGQGGGDYKVIVSLRTEFYGRLVAAIRGGPAGAPGVRDYFLADLDRDALIAFVTRPTADRPIEHAREIPAARYGFRYANEVPGRIADELLRAGRTDGVLPLAQVVCAHLLDRLGGAGAGSGAVTDSNPASGRVVTLADLDSLGGFDGVLARHVDEQMAAVLPARTPTRAWAMNVAGAFVAERAWTRPALQRLMTGLTLSQADGYHATAMLPERDLQARYGGLAGLDFETLLDRAVARRLLRVTSRRGPDGAEERLVSLGHDALTRVTAPWKRDLERRAERRRWRTVMGLVGLVAMLGSACVGLWLLMASDARARQARKDAAITNALLIARSDARAGNYGAALEALRRAEALFDLNDTKRFALVSAERQEYRHALAANESKRKEVVGHIERGLQFYNTTSYRDAVTAHTQAIQADPAYAPAYLNRANALYWMSDYQKATDDYTTAIKLDPGLTAALIGRGQALAAQGQYKEAIDDYDRAREGGDDSSLLLGLRGEALLGALRDEEAFDAYDQAIRRGGDSARLFNGRGAAWFYRGEYARAVADYDEAIRRDPTMAQAYANRGNARRLMKEYDRAFADLEAAVRINPNLAVAYQVLGHTWRDKGDHEKAVAQYGKAIEHGGGTAAVYRARGDAWYSCREYLKAIADYTETVNTWGASAEILNNRGTAHHSLKEYAAAIADYTGAIKLRPDFATAYANRGNSRRLNGEGKAALADLDEAVRLDPKLAYAYEVRGDYWHFFKDYGRAVADYTESLRRVDANEEVLNKRGNSYHAAKEYAAAIADYTGAIKLRPDFATAYANRGNSRRLNGEGKAALADLDEAVRLDPKLAHAYESRGDYWYFSSDYGRAVADYTEAVRNGGASANLLNYRGIAHHFRKEYTAAIADFTEAIRLDPSLVIAYSNRGSSHLLLGEDDAALADLDEAVRRDSKLASAYRWRGDYYYGRDPERAIADYDRAVELGEASMPLFNSRGNLWYRKGEYARAIADYDRALAVDATSSVTYVNRGDSWWYRGDHDRALADYQAAIRIDPNDAQAHSNCGDVWRLKGDDERAIPAYARAAELDPGLLYAHLRLADLFENHHRWADAAGERQAVLRLKKQGGNADERDLADHLALLSLDLMRQSKWAEAEPVLWELVGLRVATAPDDWKTFNARAMLGGSLLGQGKYLEAEFLVVSGYEGIRARSAAIPPPAASRLTEAAESVVALYRAWGRQAQADEWARRVGLADLPTDVFAPRSP